MELGDRMPLELGCHLLGFPLIALTRAARDGKQVIVFIHPKPKRRSHHLQPRPPGHLSG